MEFKTRSELNHTIYICTLKKFLLCAQPPLTQKVLYIDPNLSSLLSAHFNPTDLYNIGISLVYTFGYVHDTPHKVPDLTDFIEIYLFEQFISVEHILKTIMPNSNKKYIYSIGNESPFVDDFIKLNKLPHIMELTYCDMSWKCPTPNMFSSITESNINNIVSNAHFIGPINSKYRFGSNALTTSYVVEFPSYESPTNLFIKWDYLYLLDHFKLLDAELIKKSKTDPYYYQIWNISYKQAIEFFTSETKRLKESKRSISDFRLNSLKESYLTIHLTLLDKLNNIINETKLYEMSTIENNLLAGQLTLTEATKLYNPSQCIKLIQIDKIPKIKPIPNEFIVNFNTRIKDTLYDRIVRMKASYGIPDDSMLFVIVNNPSLTDSIQCSRIANLIILTPSEINFEYISTIGFNIPYIELKSNVLFSKKGLKSEIINPTDSQPNKYHKLWALLKEVETTNKGPFDDMSINKTKLFNLSVSIKREYESLQLKLKSPDIVIRQTAKIDMNNLTALVEKYQVVASNHKKLDFKYNVDLNSVEYEQPEEYPLLVQGDQGYDYSQELSQRETEIETLTNTIHELNELFCATNILLQDQGTVLDSIEYNICSANDTIESGNQQLTKAEKYQSKSHTILKTILGVIGGLGLVTGTILGITLKK
jgi:hypothetical protein